MIIINLYNVKWKRKYAFSEDNPGGRRRKTWKTGLIIKETWNKQYLLCFKKKKKSRVPLATKFRKF